MEKKSKVNIAFFSFLFSETLNKSNIGWVLSNMIEGALSNANRKRISL
jgi:hypothetical protein